MKMLDSLSVRSRTWRENIGCALTSRGCHSTDGHLRTRLRSVGASVKRAAERWQRTVRCDWQVEVAPDVPDHRRFGEGYRQLNPDRPRIPLTVGPRHRAPVRVGTPALFSRISRSLASLPQATNACDMFTCASSHRLGAARSIFRRIRRRTLSFVSAANPNRLNPAGAYLLMTQLVVPGDEALRFSGPLGDATVGPPFTRTSPASRSNRPSLACGPSRTTARWNPPPDSPMTPPKTETLMVGFRFCAENPRQAPSPRPSPAGRERDSRWHSR